MFVNAAVPFVAFGIVDQSVLLWAGDAIDNTMGVYFGLPTLAAAAMGQVFSDASGVLFGGTIEAMALRLGLPLPGLTDDQIRLAVTKQVSTFGGVVGIVTGCLIGMCNLFLMDLQAAERAKKAKELDSIMKTVIEDGRTVLHCDRATLWAVDEEAGELWSSVAHGVEGILRIPNNSKSLAGWCAQHKEMMNIPEVKKDPRWAGGPVKAGQFVPVSMICAPVILDGKVIAVIQLLNKLDDDKNPMAFNMEDERVVKMLAAHVAIFMENAVS